MPVLAASQLMTGVAAGGVGLLLLLGPAAAVAARWRAAGAIVYCACALASAALAAAAAATLAAGGAPLLELPIGLPLANTRLGWDALAAAFAVIVNGVTAVVSWYAIGYGNHLPEPRRVLPFYPAFLAGMNLVLLAHDAFAFLVGWEFMSLASWALVVSDHHDPRNRQAGLVYLVMAFGGTLCLLMFFGLLAGHAGGYGFEQMRAADLPASVRAAALLLALAGAGSKAGVFPLHAWLPLAHPAAPSHVSALMSGVMTKVAVYAFARFALDLAAPGADGHWLGGLLVMVGAATAVYGVVAALLETDVKRILAFSTIENIGLIFAALGLTLAFQSRGLGAAAALALTTALLHSANHAIMKSALFMGAGAVVAATGERSIDAHGGLARRMPRTAAATMIAALAIAALPPLNGFVSEWLLFQSVLASPALADWFLKLVVPAAGAAFALAAALAAAVFVRLLGISFLGRARSDAAAGAVEADAFSTSAALLAAAGCVVLGALPGLAIEPLQPVVQALLGARLPDSWSGPWGSLAPLPTSASSYNGLVILAFLVASALLAALLLRLAASAARRRAPAWDCGYPDAGRATQYSAESFAEPLKRVFGQALFQARERVHLPPPGDLRPAVAEIHWRDLAWEGLYQPLGRGVLWCADRLNVLQFLTIRRYLVLVFAALVMLLVVVAAWA